MQEMTFWKKSYVSCLCASLFVLCAGCRKDNPGLWQAAQVKAQIAESLEMTNVEVKANTTDGGFEGTGMRGAEKITFKITQDPNAFRMSWEARGDRGFFEDGYYELVQ